MEYINITVTPVRVTIESMHLEEPLVEIPKGSKVGEPVPFECSYNGSRVTFFVKESDEEERELLRECIIISNLPGRGYLLRGTLSFCKDYRICIACKEPIIKTVYVNSSFYEE